MKNFLQAAFLPFAIFSGGILFIGCEQSQHNDFGYKNQVESSPNPTQSKLTSGNMLYILRDVADVQMKSGLYIEQLKETQTSLENSVSNQDKEQLKNLVPQLKTQITELNDSLKTLSLKSQEISDIRLKMQKANDQLLSSNFLKGDIDLSKMDFKKIETQMNNIQDEMIKLTTMLFSSDKTKKN